MNIPVLKPTAEPLQVELTAPLQWLALGWADFRRNPVPGFLHGFALAAFGWLLLLVAWNQFWLLAGAYTGFLIVAPVLTTGLYQVSRSCATGRCVGMGEVVALWRSADRRLVRFGLLLGLAGTGWVLTSAGLITVFAGAPVHSPIEFLRSVVMAPSPGLFEAWVLLGGALAAPMFASSVVALPMLVDTKVTVMEAVHSSWRAVAYNPLPLALWALIILVLIGLSMLTGLVGLVVVLPVLAHASWHAYKALVHPVPSIQG